MTLRRTWLCRIGSAALWFLFAQASAQGVYQEPQGFLREAFAGRPPKPRFLWIVRSLQPPIKEILGHDLDTRRIRYWEESGRTAWILEEIGKEQPITVGIVIDRGRIERLKVLVFRESRGSEVRYPFLTDQFEHAGLLPGYLLDRHIDGVSGATLSVRALVKLSRLALYFHRVRQSGDGTP